MKGALDIQRPFAKVQVSALFHMRDINSGKKFPPIYQNFVRRHARPDETFMNIQLFREMLSEKGHATIPKGIEGGFVCPVLQRNWKNGMRGHGHMFVSAKKATKIGLTATVVRNSVLIISHITFQGCRVHIFPDNLSRNSCILERKTETARSVGRVYWKTGFRNSRAKGKKGNWLKLFSERLECHYGEVGHANDGFRGFEILL